MRNRKILIILSAVLLIAVVILTGCSNKEAPSQEGKEVISTEKNNDEKNNDEKNNDEKNNDEKDNDEKDNDENKVAIKIDRTEDFADGYATISETIDFVQTNYVIDENFKVTTSYVGNSGYVGGYQIRQNDDKSYRIVDIYGKDALTYGEHEYEKVQLLGNGLVLLVKKTDTYNSSETLGGVYDLKDGKYVLEPSKEYISFYEKGDNMYAIDGLDDTYFNTKTKKVVPFNRYTAVNFSDGFGVDDSFESSDDSYYVDVWDDNGGFKRIKGVELHGNSSKTFANGILFNSLLIIDYDENHNHVMSNHSHICNLSTGEVVDLGRDEYHMLTNNVTFTSDGYALVTFNNQGGTPYYTIIDTKGNKQFEPVKVNDNSAFSPDDNGEKRIIRQTELYEGNYIIAEDEGKNVVLDVKNNIVLKAAEYESFLGITNKVVKVIRKEPGHYDEHYYKDLNGNKIQIYK